jgi:hypothetical protein
MNQRRLRSENNPVRAAGAWLTGRRAEVPALRFLRRAPFLEGGLRGGEAGDGDAEGRAAHVVQADAVAELHAVGIAAVFAADAGLDLAARAAISR